MNRPCSLDCRRLPLSPLCPKPADSYYRRDAQLQLCTVKEGGASSESDSEVRLKVRLTLRGKGKLCASINSHPCAGSEQAGYCPGAKLVRIATCGVGSKGKDIAQHVGNPASMCLVAAAG